MSSPDRLNIQEEREKQYTLLALNREEIPIIHSGQYPGRNPTFTVPIPPEVFRLSPEVLSNEERANNIFDDAWALTVDEVEEFIESPENNVGKEEKSFLNSLLSQGREHWRPKTFDRARNSLLAPFCGFEATVLIHRPLGISAPDQVRFSLEKAKAYTNNAYMRKGKISFSSCFVFFPKNVDNLVQASVLKNWCIVYLNQSLRMALGLETPEPTSVL